MLFSALMLSLLTATSVSSLDKLKESHQLADEIFKKQGECETYYDPNPEVLEEGNDMFPNTPNQQYFNCYKSLDSMKNTYIQNNLLGLSFYDALFPMRLSNGSLVFVPLPLERESTDIPIEFSEYSVLQEICRINKTCKIFQDDMTSALSSGDIADYVYYKEKLSHCIALLDEFKSKFVNDNNLNRDLLKIIGILPILCDKEFVSMPLPESLMDDKVSSDSKVDSLRDSSILSSASDPNTVEIQADRNKNEVTSGSHIDGSSHINAIPIRTKPKQLEQVLNESKLNTLETERHIVTDKFPAIPPEQHASEHKSSPTNVEDTNSSSHDDTTDSENGGGSSLLKESKDKDSRIEVVSVTITSPESKNDGIYKPITLSSDSDYDAVESPHNNVASEISSDTSESLPKPTVKNEEALYSDQDSTSVEPTNDASQEPLDHGPIITATPAPITEGNEIAQLEDDCNELIQMANKLLELQLYDSLSHVDDDHAWCMFKLSILKLQYIERHEIDVSGYKSVFPVVLSSGVQRLVLLPPPHPRQPSLPREPPQQHSDDLFRDPTDPDGFTDQHWRANYRHRVIVENPAFISNEMFYEYVSQNNKPSEESTLSRIANMIHRNVGHSDRALEDE